jgi:hypothetical protein
MRWKKTATIMNEVAADDAEAAETEDDDEEGPQEGE